MTNLVRSAIVSLRNERRWREDLSLENRGRETLQDVANRWDEIVGD